MKKSSRHGRVFRMLKRPNLFYALTGLVVVGVLLFDVRPEAPSGVPLEVQLRRGPLTIYDYPSAR